MSGYQLGSINPSKGEYFDSDELPSRFRRRKWELWEVEAVDSAGASLITK